MQPGQGGCGQVQQSLCVLKHHAAFFGISLPVAPAQREVSVTGCRRLLEKRDNGGFLRRADYRYARFHNTQFFGGDFFERAAQKFLMVDADWCDNGQFRPQYIRCIQPAAQAHLKQQKIGRCFGKGAKRGGGRNLEKSDRFFRVCRFAALKKLVQILLVNWNTAQIDTFMEIFQVWRGITVHTVSAGL